MTKPFALSVLACALFSTTYAQVDPNRVIVTVNGEPIRGATYFKRMEILPGVGRMSAGRFVPATPGFLTLQQLINEKLMLQLARERGVLPTDAQVRQEIERRTRENPQFVEMFTQVGLTQADLEYDIRVQLAEFNVLTQGINITDQEVDNFFRENPSLFTVPKRYTLRVIAVRDPARRTTVDNALQSGQAFAEVARAHSEEATAPTGGLIGEVIEDQLAKPVRDALAPLARGQRTGWIPSGESSVMFFVEDLVPSRLEPMTPELRVATRRRLMMDRGMNVNNPARLMNEMRAKANIQFTGTPFDEQIKAAFGRS